MGEESGEIGRVGCGKFAQSMKVLLVYMAALVIVPPPLHLPLFISLHIYIIVVVIVIVIIIVVIVNIILIHAFVIERFAIDLSKFIVIYITINNIITITITTTTI